MDGRHIKLAPGQTVFNARWIAYETGLDEKWIRKAIKRLIADGEIKLEYRARRFLMVTLVNYDEGRWSLTEKITHKAENDPKREFTDEEKGSHNPHENTCGTKGTENSASEMGTHNDQEGQPHGYNPNKEKNTTLPDDLHHPPMGAFPFEEKTEQIEIHTGFWRDPYVAEQLTEPFEKMLYLFLFINGRASWCGIYAITPKQIANETDVSLAEVETIMARLERDGKIRYEPETGEILALDWMEYRRWKDRPKVKGRMIEDLKKVKTRAFVEAWYARLAKTGHSLDAAEVKPNPDVKKLGDHFHDAYKEAFGNAPDLTQADFGAVKAALRKRPLEKLKSVVEFAIDILSQKDGFTITLKGCVGSFATNTYNQEWAKRQSQYGEGAEAPTNEKWWRE